MMEIRNALKAIIEEAVPGIEFDPETDGARTLKELGIDSLDKMSILLAVQEKWNREFTESEINELNTIDEICRKVG